MECTIIGICDDQPMIIRELQQMIVDICEKWVRPWEVRTYTSGEELLEQIQELSIVFLDIEMPGMDGIELGKVIRQRKPECKIIMATGRTERFKEVFQFQAMRYVTKPFERKEVEEALMAALGSDLGQEPLELYLQRNKYVVKQRDVQYIEAYNGYVEAMVDGKRFRRDVSLDDMEERLDRRIFVRINRKIIVNLRWVQAYRNHHIYIGDAELVVSRRRQKEVESRYIEFDLKYRREFS